MINALYTLEVTSTKGDISALHFINQEEAHFAKYKLQSKGFIVDFDGYGYQIVRSEAEVDSFIDMFTD